MVDRGEVFTPAGMVAETVAAMPDLVKDESERPTCGFAGFGNANAQPERVGRFGGHRPDRVDRTARGVDDNPLVAGHLLEISDGMAIISDNAIALIN